jgi:hypothetical protein
VNWLKIGFSARKTNLSLYLSAEIKEHAAFLEKFGTYKTGAGCLYTKSWKILTERFRRKL